MNGFELKRGRLSARILTARWTRQVNVPGA
jgi:hypothetical protein